MSYCHSAPSVVRPSVRPSSVRPASVVRKLSHFRLLLWNRWTEFNRNLTGSKISTSSTKFVFFGPIGKTIWPPWPLIGWDIFDFSSETAEQNSTKLDRKQDLNVLYQVWFFWADRKNNMAALASDWLRHFRLLLWNRWTEFNETVQEARYRRPVPSLCFSGLSEKQDGRPGLWLAETFWTSALKPLNGIQRNLTGSKISTSSTKFVFFGPIGKTRWPPWPLIGWDIFDFSSETAKRNSTKLDRKQDLNALYQVCVFRADQKKTRWPPWPLIGWDIFDFSSETAERNSPKLDRKQDLNTLDQVCVLWADRKNKIATPGLWLAETFSTSPLKPLNGIQRNLIGSKFLTSSTKFVFFRADWKKPALASDLLRHIWTFPLKPLNRIQRNLTGSKILGPSTKFVFFGPKS